MYIKWNKRGVRVGFALIGGVCVSLPLLKCSAVRAAATDLDPYTLSQQQALALYGTSIDVDIYNGSSIDTYSAQYVGCTADYSALHGYPSSQTGITYYDSPSFYDLGGFMTFERFANTNFLIYRFAAGQIADTSSFSFSMRISTAVDITAYGYGTSVFWSIPHNTDQGMIGSGAQSSLTVYGQSLEDMLVSGSALRKAYNSQSKYGRINTIVLPVLTEQNGLYYFGAEVSQSFTGCAALAGATISGGDPITVGTQMLYARRESIITPANYYDFSTGTASNTNVTGDESPDTGVYVLLQCPTLYGEYILPDSGGEDGVDLTQIEEYLEQQTSDISNISEESTVQTRQLIAILAKLEQIYQKISSVDLSVPTLSTAPNIPIDSDIDSRIIDDLDSYEMPDIDESLDLEKISSFSEFIMSYTRIIPVEIIGASAFLLFFSFAMWIIFRGRGS